jgi:hypothetical protein
MNIEGKIMDKKEIILNDMTREISEKIEINNDNNKRKGDI